MKGTKRSGKTLFAIQELRRWQEANPGKTALFLSPSEAAMARALELFDSLPRPEPRNSNDGGGEGEGGEK